MKRLKILVHLVLILTVPSLFAHSQNELPHLSAQEVSWWWGDQEQEARWVCPTTYDEITQMLEDLESGELQQKYAPDQLERVNEYLSLLAREGILPGECDEEIALEEDTYDLMYGENSLFQLNNYLENGYPYMITPAVLHSGDNCDIIQCGLIKKLWKKTKKFVKKHKKAIIIGAVIVVAVVAVTVAVVAASSGGAAAGTAAGAIGKATSHSNNSGDKSPSCVPNESPPKTSSDKTPIVKPAETQPQKDLSMINSAIEREIVGMKATIASEKFFEPPTGRESLPLEETGRALAPLFAHDSLYHLNDAQFSNPYNPKVTQSPLEFAHNEIDRKFGSYYGTIFSDPAKEVNFNALSYQVRGEAALSHGYQRQAVSDFTKAIHLDPKDPMPYLQRSASYFDMGEYAASMEDFDHFTSQMESDSKKIPFSTKEFSLGFAKGLPRGIYESGKGLMVLLGDLVTHPIHTSMQMYHTIEALAKLVRDDEWEAIGEALSPEVHRLVTEWDTLPSDKRGELAGYAFGKHGTDILAPGGIAKVAVKSAKGAKELATALKNVQNAEKMVVLETAAKAGNTVKVGELVHAGKSATALGEELGLPAREILQLEKTGKLSKLDQVVPPSESKVLKSAISQNKHVDTVERCLSSPEREIRKSIRSFEKQIVKHKDKIANPSKYVTDWEKRGTKYTQKNWKFHFTAKPIGWITAEESLNSFV